MKNLFLITTLLLSFACTRPNIPEQSANSAAPRSSPSASASPTPSPERIDAALQTELAKIVEAAKGRVGVGAVLVETGETAYLDRTGLYPMQSVYKLPIAMALLKIVDEGRVRLDQEIAITPDRFVRQGLHSPIRDSNPDGVALRVDEILRYAVSESDGTASDVLLDLAGGPEAVMNYLKSIGVSDLTVADSEKSISKDWETQYRNWSTPEAAIRLLRGLHERGAQLTEEPTQLLLRLMTETKTGQQRIKHGLIEGATLAHKTGTGGTRNGITGATNDIGIITLPDGRHIMLAVFVSDSPAADVVREKVIADIARAVLAKWAARKCRSM